MWISSLSFHNIQKVQLLLCSFPQNTIALGCSAGMRGRVLGPPWRFSIYEYLHFIYMCVHAKSLSHVQLFVTPWTVACQLPLSMGFSRQEYQSGLPFPPPGDLSGPEIESTSPVSPALAGRFFTTELPRKLSFRCTT